MRIVSLVPSLTKTLCDFGCRDQIVGVTKFCGDPPDIHRSVKLIGGTKDPDLDLIRALNPSRIVVNQEENRQFDVEILQGFCDVLVTFPKSPRDVSTMLLDLGKFVGRIDAANILASDVNKALDTVMDHAVWQEKIGPRFLYLIWRDPWMGVAQDTYISKFLEILGFQNAIEDDQRYPSLDISQIRAAKPDVIFLSSEPWPFRRRDAAVLREMLGSDCPPLYWIDGKAMSWYGTTTLSALRALQGDPFASGLVRAI